MLSPAEVRVQSRKMLLVECVSEADWQRAVEQTAREFGWLTFHPRISKGSEKGYPDLTMVRLGPPARLVFAELKVGRGKLRPEQASWLMHLARVEADVNVIGGQRIVSTHVWRHPADWDRVIDFLKPEGWAFRDGTLYPAGAIS